MKNTTTTDRQGYTIVGFAITGIRSLSRVGVAASLAVVNKIKSITSK